MKAISMTIGVLMALVAATIVFVSMFYVFGSTWDTTTHATSTGAELSSACQKLISNGCQSTDVKLSNPVFVGNIKIITLQNLCDKEYKCSEEADSIQCCKKLCNC